MGSRPEETDSDSGAGGVSACALDFAALPEPDMLDVLEHAPDGAPGAAASLQTLANYLTSGYWTDTGRTSRYFNLTNAGTGANAGVLYYNVSGYSGDANGISAARANLVREAFKIYSEVLGITFIETTSTADHVDFFFQDNQSGAYNSTAVHSGTGGPIDYNIINVEPGWYGGSSAQNDYTFQTFLHEIGHGLGLGHQGNYNAGNGNPTYATTAIWANDGWQQSMMSYWSQSENTWDVGSYAQLISPMPADWIALNTLYAWQGYGTSHAFTGNTVWGFGTNISTATSNAYANIADFADTNAFCIVDSGGIDTVDFSNYFANQTINLLPSSSFGTTASLSSVGGLINNMSIAVGTIIENANGGWGNDSLYGNNVANVLDGNAGNDYILAFDGNDFVYGGAGNDTIYGYEGNDTIYAGAGNDYANGNDGNDRIDDLPDGGGGNDTFYGGSGNDTLYGYTGNDQLFGEADNDYVSGEAGADTLYGGAGADTVYGGSDNDIVYDDDFVTFDYNDGGSGVDWIDYSLVTFANGVVTIDLNAGLTTVGVPGGNTETILNFENVRGSQGGETIRGNAAANVLGGQGGNDVIDGMGGNDTLYGDQGNDTIMGGAGNDTISGFDGNDSMLGGAGNDRVSGSAGNDTAYGGAGNDTVIGEAGSDRLFGDAGNDRLEGGAERDILTGGAGRDILIGGGNSAAGAIRGDSFVFSSVSDSPWNAAGTLCDVLQAGGGGAAFDLPGAGNGDRIDVSGIDANALVAGNQAFLFGGGTGVGRIWCVNQGNVTVVLANVDGDAAAEFRLHIEDGGVLANAYTAADFIL